MYSAVCSASSICPILARCAALGAAPGMLPAPAGLLALPEAQVHACGFSGAKIAALRDLAAHAEGGSVPSQRACARLTDADLIARLTAIRGVRR